MVRMRGTLAAENGTLMGHTPTHVVIGAVAFMVLDGVWALFGLVVYGVYDFTNYSTRRQWPFVVTLADVAWGTFATAACAAVVRLVVR